MAFADLAKNTSVLAFTRLIEFAAGLVRVKLTALYLGVKGMGVVEQLTFFAQQTSTFTLLSMGEGLVKQIAENQNDKAINKIVCSALKGYLIMIACFMFLSIGGLLLFEEHINTLVFGESDYLYIYYIAICSVPILILNSIPFSILKAFKGTRVIAIARIYIVAINLIFLIPLILLYGLDGVVIYVFISYVVTLAVNFSFAKRNYFERYGISLLAIMKAKVLKRFVKELFVFSGFGLTVGLLFIVSEMFIRGTVVNKLGIESIGLYSPVIMWASMLTGVLLPSFSTYLYPRFCELSKYNDITALLNDGLRLGTFALAPFMFLGIPFKSLFITVFYSNEFSGASEFIPYHFLGMLFYVWWYVFSQSLTPTGRIKQHGVFLLTMYATNVLVVFLLIDELGIYAYMLKFIIPPLIFVVVYYLYCKFNMKFRFSRENIILMIYVFLGTLLTIVVSTSADYFMFSYVLGPLLFIGMYFLLIDSEKAFLFRILSKYSFVGH